MAITFFSALLFSIAKGGIWICFGMIIYKHYDFIFSFITSKFENTQNFSSEKIEDIHKYIKWIGLCVLFIGITTITSQVLTLGFTMSH